MDENKHKKVGHPFSKLRADIPLAYQRSFNIRHAFIQIAQSIVILFTLGQVTNNWTLSYIIDKSQWQAREMKRIHGDDYYKKPTSCDSLSKNNQ